MLNTGIQLLNQSITDRSSISREYQSTSYHPGPRRQWALVSLDKLTSINDDSMVNFLLRLLIIIRSVPIGLKKWPHQSIDVDRLHQSTVDDWSPWISPPHYVKRRFYGLFVTSLFALYRAHKVNGPSILSFRTHFCWHAYRTHARREKL